VRQPSSSPRSAVTRTGCATRAACVRHYHALWRWSTTDLDAFWQSIWDYHALQSPTPHRAVLARNVMPGAEWFPGAQVNYARQVLRHVARPTARGCRR
jgi:acetoacetyl-CoA synthetase